MQRIIILMVTLSTVLCQTTPASLLKKCTNSAECPEGECCVNPATDRLVDLYFHSVFGAQQDVEYGQCVKRFAKKGEVCEGCVCEDGTTCYRPMEGLCCFSRICYDSEYVNKRKEYWKNCKLPTCFWLPDTRRLT
ncbi:hypothetical protein SNEBB_005238 [Seison nebaliae]|nr:hypothetical protein SNEBB_005238 [Seison nebaliae]